MFLPTGFLGNKTEPGILHFPAITQLPGKFSIFHIRQMLDVIFDFFE